MSKKSWTIALLALTALALLLRLHGLTRESLFMDEVRQASYHQLSWGEMVPAAATQQQPPLDYWVGKAVAAVVPGDLGARLPAALFGTLAVLLLTVLARTLAPAPVALLTGLLAALLPFNLYFSQDARPYAIAICLFTALLLCLRWLLARPGAPWLPLAATGAVAFAYLLSRGLSPLVSTAVCAACCLLLALPAWRRRQEEARRLLLAAGVMAAAGAAFLPFFRVLLESSRRYVPGSEAGAGAMLAQGAREFTLVPLWRAFIAQADPAGLLLLPFLLAVPLLLWVSPARRRDPWFLLLALTALAAPLAELFAFHATSGLPWRPPYPVYLLPCALLLCAAVWGEGWERLSRPGTPRLLRGLGMALLAVILAAAAWGAAAFKAAPPRKEDWRGLAAHLARTAGPGQVILMDALADPGGWEPGFYGFPRYYRGKSPLVEVKQVPGLASQMATLPQEPVLVLFSYRNYRLHPGSPYPLIPRSSFPRYAELPDLDLSALRGAPGISVTEFPAFIVARLSRPEGNLARDTLALLEAVLERLSGTAFEPVTGDLRTAEEALRPMKPR